MRAPRVLERPLVAVSLGAACISSSAVLVALSAAGAATTAVFRCLFALPLLVPIASYESRRRGRRPLASHAAAAGAGVFLAIDLVLWTHAINDVGAGVATVLGNLQVLFVAFGAWALVGERPGKRLLAALPIVLTGVVLVSGLVGHHAVAVHPLAGVGYGVATSIAYAAYLLAFRRAAGSVAHVAGPLADSTFGAAVGAILLGLGFGSLQWTPSWSALGWLALLGLTSQVLGWLLITSALPRLPAGISALMLLIQPVAALGLAALVLGERPSLIQIAGAALVCGGVLLVARSPRPDRAGLGVGLPVPAGEPVVAAPTR